METPSFSSQCSQTANLQQKWHAGRDRRGRGRVRRRRCFEGHLDDFVPGLLSSEASHLSKLVQGLDTNTTILVCPVLHKGPHAVSADLGHSLVQLNIYQHTLNTHIQACDCNEQHMCWCILGSLVRNVNCARHVTNLTLKIMELGQQTVKGCSSVPELGQTVVAAGVAAAAQQ